MIALLKANQNCNVDPFEAILITGNLVASEAHFWCGIMSRQDLESMPSRAWSCTTLDKGVEMCAKLAGISLDTSMSKNPVQA